MKFKLKNQKHQAEIEEKFPEFDKHLQKQCQKQMDDETGFVLIIFDPSEDSRVVVAIPKEEVLVIPEYNPYEWNSFPEVAPPMGVQMRVEGQYLDGHPLRTCAVFLHDKWFCFDDDSCELHTVKRFRPWE